MAKKKYNSKNRTGKPRGPYTKKAKAEPAPVINVKKETVETTEKKPEEQAQVKAPAEETKPIEIVTEKEKEPEPIIPEAAVDNIDGDGSNKFDEFVKSNEVKEDVKSESEAATEDKKIEEVKPAADKEETGEIVYEEEQSEEEIAAEETESDAAKKSFREIASKKGQMFNVTMLIAAMDFLFPKLLKFYYKQIKGDNRIDKINFSKLKLTGSQIESLGDSTEAMAEFIFQYINPAWMFLVGVFMHYDSNIQAQLDTLPKEEKATKEMNYAGQRGA